MTTGASRKIGAYELGPELASGGMATVHLGRAPSGNVIAIKALHPGFGKDPDFVRMFQDEARLAPYLRHSNVVSAEDVVATGDELFIVMEYVEGETLARVMQSNMKTRAPVPPAIAIAVACGVLRGLHAAHEAVDSEGRHLAVVHRDVSPQNIMIDATGTARVLDFGVAKATGRIQTTHEGQIKGKISYMAPEQLRDRAIDRRTDVYAASVVLWEMLTGRRLFHGTNHGAIVERVLMGLVYPPSKYVPALTEGLDASTLRGLDRDPSRRWSTALEMAEALEATFAPAPHTDVARWMHERAADALSKRAQTIAAWRVAMAEERAMQAAPPASIAATTGRKVGRGLVVAAASVILVTVLVVAGRTVVQPAPPLSVPVDSATAEAPLIAPLAEPERLSASSLPPSLGDNTTVPNTPTTSGRRPARAPPSHTAYAAHAPHAAPAASDPCRIPYTVDANGVKTYNRNCL